MGYLYHIFETLPEAFALLESTCAGVGALRGEGPLSPSGRVCVVGVFQAREDEQKRDDTYDIL